MKNFVREIRTTSSYLKAAAILLVNGMYDSFRMIRYTHFWSRAHGLIQLEAKLWAQAHVLEKGLSLPQTRIGYGSSGVKALIQFCRYYADGGFPSERPAIKNAISVLHSYIEFHEKNRFDVTSIKEMLAEMSAPYVCDRGGGAGLLEFPRDEYQSLARRDFSALAGSRYSIRAFGSGTVSEQDVRRALEIARKTPSACNRQSWNVYWIKSPELKERLLRIQSGHRGFGEQVDSFLVITSDIQSYFGVEERHQTFVDGGLYSMSVLYALHYIGLGACPLNWCVTWRKDQAMFSALGIPKSQNIIMILAIGTLPDTVKVAKSIRKTVSDTLKVV